VLVFQINDRVIYGIHGACDIKAVERQTSGGKTQEYLVLEPVNQTGARFLVPTHNAAAMAKLQKMLTKEELEQLLRSDSVHEFCWIQEENFRKQTYRELISGGDRVRLMAMVHTLYCHRTEQTASGRKVHVCDENFLRDAEKLLSGEISMVMEMDPDAARQFIRSALK